MLFFFFFGLYLSCGAFHHLCRMKPIRSVASLAGIAVETKWNVWVILKGISMAKPYRNTTEVSMIWRTIDFLCTSNKCVGKNAFLCATGAAFAPYEEDCGGQQSEPTVGRLLLSEQDLPRERRDGCCSWQTTGFAQISPASPINLRNQSR